MPSSSAKYLISTIYLCMTRKGGDFMGLEDEVNRMIWEGSPVPAGCNPTVRNSRFPEVVGRTRFNSALEIADPATDPVAFKSASRMIAGE